MLLHVITTANARIAILTNIKLTRSCSLNSDILRLRGGISDRCWYMFDGDADSLSRHLLLMFKFLNLGLTQNNAEKVK